MQMLSQINLQSVLSALSMALEFTGLGLGAHHQRVAFVSLCLGEAAGLSPQQLETLYISATLHDIGAISFEEKKRLHKFELSHSQEHCRQGFNLLSNVPIFSSLAEIVLHHHTRWDGAHQVHDAETLTLSSIIHLSDRVDVLIDTKADILNQRHNILSQIEHFSGNVFNPDLCKLLEGLSQREAFWLDLMSPFVEEQALSKLGKTLDTTISFEDLASIAHLFSVIIDSKSKFTYRHSNLVSRSAAALARLAGFTPEETDRISIAGLLHDLGKLSVPEQILEKPGALTNEEYNIIKRHTYYTYRILSQVPQFKEIAGWAAFHHERMDGKGYPFKFNGRQLDTGARIMSVADLFSALAENRPYRQGLPKDKISKIMLDSQYQGAIDGDLTALLLDNYHIFEENLQFSVFDSP